MFTKAEKMNFILYFRALTNFTISFFISYISELIYLYSNGNMPILNCACKALSIFNSLHNLLWHSYL